MKFYSDHDGPPCCESCNAEEYRRLKARGDRWFADMIATAFSRRWHEKLYGVPPEKEKL